MVNIIHIQFSSITQPCPTLCNPTDCSLPGSSVPDIRQARLPEWAAIPDPEVKPRSPALHAGYIPSEPAGK